MPESNVKAAACSHACVRQLGSGVSFVNQSTEMKPPKRGRSAGEADAAGFELGLADISLGHAVQRGDLVRDLSLAELAP
jgi:hypothetical protein